MIGPCLTPCCVIPQFSYPRFAKDGKWYWNYNSGLQAQYILFRSKTSELPKFDVDGDEGPESQAEVFFDVRGVWYSPDLFDLLTTFLHLAEPVGRRRNCLSGYFRILERWKILRIWNLAVGIGLFHHLHARIIKALQQAPRRRFLKRSRPPA